MPGTIKYGERKLEKIAEFYYSLFFCKSLVYASYFNRKPLCLYAGAIPSAAVVGI